MIVADTSAVVALVDADDRHHARMAELFRADPDAWILPWAILPEVTHLLHRHVGGAAASAFARDLAEGRYALDRGEPADFTRAADLEERHPELGFVDAIVVAVAERQGASAIATLDQARFVAIDIRGKPKILPRDR